jgi:hypothetical protein
VHLYIIIILIRAERPINVIKEEKIESFVQPDITSALDEDEEAFTDSVRKTSVKEQKQNVLKSSEQKIKETRQVYIEKLYPILYY